MRRPQSRAPLGPALRRIIALALAPAGCFGEASHQPVADTAGIPADAVVDAACSLDPSRDSCAPACDPSPFEDGGTGACAPRWIQGDGCQGGEVLFACGLPTAPVVSNAFQACATYCMGSMNFNACPVGADGGISGPFPWTVDAGGGATVVRCFYYGAGRRPTMLVDELSLDAESAGGALALAAYLEAASVQAFLELAEQLEAHRAPADLIRRVRRAASDEVRHADVMGGLARARGGAVQHPRVVRSERSALLDIALQNAVEGCVRETWGAACAILQSLRAADREVRAVMRVIARDEVAHAALSWDIADWIATRLTRKQRADVDRVRSRAIALLEEELSAPAPSAWRATLGLPSREEAFSVVRRMRDEIWPVTAAGA